ncbi:MAG: cardiolipin synthase [Thiomicrorhabdus sp.]|jgi:cardiolipin synthase|nr:cardiolipin synthase [Thiomicrorhabdus sp.]
MDFLLDYPLFWIYLTYTTLVIATVLHMLYQRRSPQNLMAWLLTLILLPFLGVFLYLLLGSRKFLLKRRKPVIRMSPISSVKPDKTLAIQLDELLRTNQIAGATLGNQISLHTDAIEAFNLFMQAIESAQSSIHLQTYIFQADCTGIEILDALARKAKQGVQVRLLMDAVGSFALYRQPKSLEKLRQAGGQYAFFQPILRSFLSNQVNLRNHRKIYLFDQTTLLTGGINLTNDYLGRRDNPPKNGRWLDLLCKIQGPNALHYQNIFNADWLYTTNETLPVTTTSPIILNNHEGELLQVIPSGPDIDSDALFETLLQSIYRAKHTIKMVTPYFVPDSSIMNALMIAVKRGVKLTLITPQTSDHLIFDLGRSSYLRELKEVGAEIFFYQTNMLHAKLTIIDQELMIIGSANIDYRSLFINHEVVNLIYSKPLIIEMQTWTDTLLLESLPYQPSDHKLRKLLENFTRIFAPIL